MLELTRLEKAIDIGYYKEALTKSLEKVYYVTFNFSVRTDFLNIFLNDNMDEIALINLSLDQVDEQYIIEKSEIEKDGDYSNNSCIYISYEIDYFFSETSLNKIKENIFIKEKEIEKELLQSVFSYGMPVKKKGRL